MQSLIRNFAIIAHVDHGKSTLSDRLLELTGTIAKDKLQEQFLDQNVISRKRGITIKLAPVRMYYKIRNPNIEKKISEHSEYSERQKLSDISDNQQYQNSGSPKISDNLKNRHTEFSESSGLASDFDIRASDLVYELNLIDTPGHVDFSYEVSRTLAACEGAILLVDATQGIQAQTVAHYSQARKLGLTLIPVLNKIDLPNAQVRTVKKELVDFGFKEDEILTISAKTGENVVTLLQRVIDRIPPPRGNDAPNGALRALIFDAVYDEYRGVIAYVRVIDGQVKKGDKIQFYQNSVKTEVTEVGMFTPFLKETYSLDTGEIGYIVAGIKDIRLCRVGDTLTIANIKDQKSNIEPLPGYKTPQPMVFFGMYPKNPNDFVNLRESLGKLTLNDTALSYTEEYSAYLGSGFRVGFLGLLHADIVKERLKQEFDLDLLLTMPQVLYKKESEEEIYEPYMLLNVYTPTEYVGNVMSVAQKKKGNLLDMQYHDAYAVLSYEMPYSMFIRGLAGDIKSVTSGFGSVDYTLTDYQKADLVKLDILINENPIDVLSELVYKDEATHVAREKAKKLKDSLDRAQFRQIIQATINGNIIAREEIPPFRKDVLQKMSGGDRTRKDKLLEAQKKGKKKMIQKGKVALSQDALFSMITEGK